MAWVFCFFSFCFEFLKILFILNFQATVRVQAGRRMKTQVKSNLLPNRIKNRRNPFRLSNRWADYPIPDPTKLRNLPKLRPDLLRHRNLLRRSVPVRLKRAATAAAVQAAKVKLKIQIPLRNHGRWATKSGKTDPRRTPTTLPTKTTAATVQPKRKSWKVFQKL